MRISSIQFSRQQHHVDALETKYACHSPRHKLVQAFLGIVARKCGLVAPICELIVRLYEAFRRREAEYCGGTVL